MEGLGRRDLRLGEGGEGWGFRVPQGFHNTFFHESNKKFCETQQHTLGELTEF